MRGEASLNSLGHQFLTPKIVTPVFTKILDGVLGAEGPVVDPKGNLFMVAPEVEENGKYAGQVLQVNLTEKQTSIYVSPAVNESGGIPAGLQFDDDGNLWVADMRLGIIKITPDGNMTQPFRNDSEGGTLQGCNDCAFDYEGSLWATAPAGDIAPAPYARSFEEAFGSVYCVVNKSEVIKVDTGLRFPNGIAVMHDSNGKPQKLIVAETPTKRLWGYDIVGPGKVENKTIWGVLPGDHEGGADGMDFDELNNLLVAHWGSGYIEVYPPNGGLPVKRIKCPFSKVSNLQFLPKSNVIFVTEHDTYGLWKFLWKRRGKLQLSDLNL